VDLSFFEGWSIRFIFSCFAQHAKQAVKLLVESTDICCRYVLPDFVNDDIDIRDIGEGGIVFGD
jgi:hypothetical protein